MHCQYWSVFLQLIYNILNVSVKFKRWFLYFFKWNIFNVHIFVVTYILFFHLSVFSHIMYCFVVLCLFFHPKKKQLVIRNTIFIFLECSLQIIKDISFFQISYFCYEQLTSVLTLKKCTYPYSSRSDDRIPSRCFATSFAIVDP